MASILEQINQKAAQAYRWLKSKAKALGDIIGGWVNRYKKYLEEVKRHQEYVAEVLDSKLEYTPEAVDVELAQRLKQKLGEIEGGKILEHIKTLDLQQRMEYFEKVLFPLIANEMGVQTQFLGWFQDNSTAGFYSENLRGIKFNALFLATDDDYILVMMINTIIHECKHAMQHDAISGRNTHGYSLELIEQWRRNFQDYIQPVESDEGYTKQPVEWDASGFAESVYPTDKYIGL